jgi:hypothetical protein
MEGVNPMAAGAEVIAAARHLSALGYNLVAVKANKAPWGKNWRRIHPLDEVVALLEGECVAIGFLGGELNRYIVALDFDNFAGEAWFRENCKRFGLDPYGWPTVITPGKKRADGMRFKGRHRYMLDDRALLGNSAGSLAQIGIDVRGKGHTVLPPSPHPDGGLYEWMEGHSFENFPLGIPPVPDFVYAAIAEPAPRPEAQNPDIPEFPAPYIEPPIHAGGNGPDAAPGWVQEAERRRAEAYCRAAFDAARTRLAGAMKGQRNIALNNEALGLGHLAYLGVFQANEVLSIFMAACTENGLLADSGIKAVHATFWSGWNKGLSEPRELKDRPQGPPRPDPRAYKPDWTAPGFGGSEPPPPPPPPGGDYDPETGEVPPQDEEVKPRPDWRKWLRWADDLKQDIVPDLKFWITALWPECWLSLLNGDGGAGKSTLLTQFLSALSSGTPIFGKATLQTSCMLISTEENDKIATRRLRGTLDVGRFPVFNLLDWPEPYELCWTRKDGLVEPLPFLQILREMIGDLGPEIVGLDHVGDLFMINENDKAEVNAALQLLRPLHAEFGANFILTQHISKAGMASGRRDAGTPAWHNKSRWRAALYPIVDDDASDDDRLAALHRQHRVLEIMKDSEGGTDGTKLNLLREKFTFVEEGGQIGKARERSLIDKLEAFIVRRGQEDKIVHWPASPFAGGSLVSLFRKSFERGAPSFNATVEAVDACVKSGALVKFETRNKAGEEKSYLRPKR